LSFNLLFMIIIGGMGSILGAYFGAAFIVVLPLVLNQLPNWLGIPMSTAMISHLEFIVFGALIVFFLIAEPHGWRACGRSARRNCGCGRSRTELPKRSGIHPSNDHRKETGNMRLATFKALAAAVSVVAALGSGAAFAQDKGKAPAKAAAAAGPMEQFFPALPYRTGAYAPNGVPWANGYADYLKLINARDGGIGGVKITYEECETGYATDRGVECYERLKGKGPTGAAVFPAAVDRHHLRDDRQDGDRQDPADHRRLRTRRFDRRRGIPFNFPLLGTYWDAADILVQHVGKLNGGLDKLRGKKIALVYHDSPYGKEPIALLQERAKMHGFELLLLPVTHPGVEQKATWLQIRQQRPDYVFLWAGA